MRIIAGSARGTRLAVPRGRATRPTTDRARERLFAILDPWLADAHVLDLFAGSGALGLEALSRGAAGCLFVDRSDEAAHAIQDNLERSGLSARGEIMACGWRAALQAAARRSLLFDLVLVDPPYGWQGVSGCLGALADGGLLAPGALVALERGGAPEQELPAGWEAGRRIDLGSTCFLLCRPATQDGAARRL